MMRTLYVTLLVIGNGFAIDVVKHILSFVDWEF